MGCFCLYNNRTKSDKFDFSQISIISINFDEDINKLLSLEKKSFDNKAFTLKCFTKLYNKSRKTSTFLILKYKNELIGYILAYLNDDNEGYIASLLILEEFRGKGLSSLLIDKVLELFIMSECNIDKISLHVRVTINLYSKYDFQIKDTIKKFYDKNEDAYFMVKILK